ncbi:MAG: hypothetical protein WC560_05230 [Syntrophales bacterium]
MQKITVIIKCNARVKICPKKRKETATYENIMPFDNSTKVAVQFLEKRIHQDDLILVSPNHMLGTMEYYLSDKLLFCNIISEDNKNLLAAGVKLPAYIYSTNTTPDWIVSFGLGIDMPKFTAKHLAKLNYSGYEIHAFLIYGPDVSRPELFWRSFVPKAKFPPEDGLFILERIKDESITSGGVRVKPLI